MDAATYIGNGPYKIAEWVPSSHITMVKNENYWNVDSLAGPDTLQFTLMEDDAAQLTAFQSGELDFIDAVPNDEIDALSSTPEFHKEGQIGTYYVSYNTQAAPFDDPLVRQAFTLAVDRDYICKQIGKSGQIPAGAFVSEENKARSLIDLSSIANPHGSIVEGANGGEGTIVRSAYLGKEMQTSFLEYAMSVIVSRACRTCVTA